MVLPLGILPDFPSPDNAPDIAGIESEHRGPHEDGEAAEVTAAVLSVAASDEGGPNAEANAGDEDPHAHALVNVTFEVFEGFVMLVNAGLAHYFIRNNYY